MPRSVGSIGSVVALLIFAAQAAFSQTIPGELRDSRNLPVPDIWTSCNILGIDRFSSSVVTSADEPGMGSFTLGGVLGAGTYTQAFEEKDGCPLLYRKGISVPATGSATVKYAPTAYCFGTQPFDASHTSYAQSFKATGSNLISAGARVVYPASGEVEVAIFDGELPSSSQIGPSRRFIISNDAIQSAYWNAGEVQTVPGRKYTARFTLVEGGAFALRRQAVRNKMRSEIPDGHTWVDDIPSDQPIEFIVNQDDAGLTNTMCCLRAGAIQYGNSAGQTFTAKGKSVLAVSWLTTDTRVPWAVAVYESPGATGVGANQIGPKKYISSSDRLRRSTVTFAPGEVPTVPGYTYFVRLIHQQSSTGINIYSAQGNDYAGGIAYKSQQVQSYDWALGIYEENTSGDLDRAKVGISNARIESVTPSSAAVRWSTDIPADSCVEYGEITPYANSVFDSTLTNNHTVSISGLKPNTLYHVRAGSRANYSKDAITDDITFVTAADASNLMVDPGFESGEFGSWMPFGTCAANVIGPGWTAGAGPHGGGFAIGGSASLGAERGGVYQRISVSSSAKYSLSAWVWTHTSGSNYSQKAHQCAVRIGIDPLGGTDPGSASIIWSPYTYSESAYSQVQISAAAASDHITAFLQGGYAGTGTIADSCAFAFDDTVLTLQTVSQMPSVGIAQALLDYADEQSVSISDVVCTATGLQTGAYYIGEPKQIGGLRVETTDTANVGDKVSVSGKLQTKPSGERYLADAHLSPQGQTAPVSPLYLRLNAAGGSALGDRCAAVPGTVGPYNVGMLVKCAGIVKALGGACTYINDGSLPGNGLKINTAGLSGVFNVGQKIAVTGIVQLEGSKGSVTVVLNPRTDEDIKIFN